MENAIIMLTELKDLVSSALEEISTVDEKSKKGDIIIKNVKHDIDMLFKDLAKTR